MLRSLLLAVFVALFCWPATPVEAADRGSRTAGKVSKSAKAKKANRKPRNGNTKRSKKSRRRAATGSTAVVAKPDSTPTNANVASLPDRQDQPNKAKTRVYSFGGLEVEGKLKAPQLLFFRSRMKQELDTSSGPRRSFMKELEQTADIRGL